MVRESERLAHKEWMKRHPLYEVYEGMMKRCGMWKMKNRRALQDYRDRGISVCKEWTDSFSDFEAWGYSNGYENGCGLFLDRIDNDGDYCPGNCRFTTRKENNRNKRDTIVVQCGDEIIPLVELFERIDSVVPYHIFRYRIKTGWSILDAAYVEKRSINDPKFKRGKKHE